MVVLSVQIQNLFKAKLFLSKFFSGTYSGRQTDFYSMNLRKYIRSRWLSKFAIFNALSKIVAPFIFILSLQ